MLCINPAILALTRQAEADGRQPIVDLFTAFQVGNVTALTLALDLPLAETQVIK